MTNDNTAYFWGQLCAGEGSSVILPKKIDVPNVVDIKATRGCTVSALKGADERIYFWGFAYGQFTKKPVATKHSSFDELFNSLDPPMMLQPFELHLKQPVIVDKLRQRFDDNVCNFFILFLVQIHLHSRKTERFIVPTHLCRQQEMLPLVWEGDLFMPIKWFWCCVATISTTSLQATGTGEPGRG